MRTTKRYEDGASPELSGSAPPEPTPSFALIAFGQDSPFGVKFTHRVLYDTPPEKRELPDGVTKTGPTSRRLPPGAKWLLQNGLRWTISSSRRTSLRVYCYALDTKLGPGRAPKKQIQKAS
jgi:hypothetical protein